MPFGEHEFEVLFSGEISPVAATLWCWVTNFTLTHEHVYAIANQGGRARNGIENVFNVQKNGWFGLEHAFCANTTASQNHHLIMQVAHTLGQLLVNGVLRRLTRACRKVTERKLAPNPFRGWSNCRAPAPNPFRGQPACCRIDPQLPACGQVRYPLFSLTPARRRPSRPNPPAFNDKPTSDAPRTGRRTMPSSRRRPQPLAPTGLHAP